MDKEGRVAMLNAAGLDVDAKERRHREFEQHAPQVHHDFPVSLGTRKTRSCESATGRPANTKKPAGIFSRGQLRR